MPLTYSEFFRAATGNAPYDFEIDVGRYIRDGEERDVQVFLARDSGAGRKNKRSQRIRLSRQSTCFPAITGCILIRKIFRYSRGESVAKVLVRRTVGRDIGRL